MSTIRIQDTIKGADGREIEIVVEDGTVDLQGYARDDDGALVNLGHLSLSWDEFDAATDKLREWRALIIAPKTAAE